MRPLVILLALVVASPFALAQGQGGDGRPDRPDGGDGNATANGTSGPGGSGMARECRGAEAPRECMQAYCEDHQEDRQCQRVAGSDCADVDCAELSQACQVAETGDARSHRACQALQRLDDARSDARHVEFELDQEGRQLRNYTVDGRLVLVSITYGDADEELEASRHGQRIRLQSGDDRMEIHDTPKGDFWFRGNDSLVLLFPDDVVLTPAPQGHLAAYGDRTAIVAGDDVTVEAQQATATGGFRFFFPVGQGPSGASDALANATARGHVGAQLDVSGAGAAVTAYDAIEVNITQPAIIQGNDTLRVLVSAELDEGRTIVLDIDPASLGGSELAFRYYDVHDGNLTQVYIYEASSLADVLDPTDDAGSPEYYVVYEDGQPRVLVSVPHWSAHVIEIASIGQFLVQPSVLLGAAAGVIGVGVAGTAMFWPRRREDYADF